MAYLFKNKYLILFIIIFVFSFILRLLPVLNNNFPFTMDQARDMLDIRNIAVGKHLTLIGPTTSINGVFLGPFYYYFNLLPFLLSNGNPAAILYWQIIWFQLSIASLWFVIKKNSPLLAVLTTGILLFPPVFFYQNRYAWTANAAPIFVAFYFSSLILLIPKNTIFKAFLTGLIAGMVFQIEAAFGILLVPFAILFLIYQKSKIKIILSLFLGFTVTLIPQLLFEFRHSFIMSQTFFNEIFGNSSILGDKLNLLETLFSHYLNFTYITHGFIQLPNIISQYIFLIALIYLIFKLVKNKLTKNISNLFILSITFILFAFILYALYQYPLKGWYIQGLYIPFAIILAIFFKDLIESSKKMVSYLILLAILIVLSLNINMQINQIPQNKDIRSGDRSNLRNELEAIDWVYQKANGQGFKVFSYIPSVYDFPYQYLFWWYGQSKYGYQPTISSYLENVPEYIQNNSAFLTNTKPLTDSYPTFLVIEKDLDMPIRQYAWRGNFTKLCQIENKIFPWETEVQMLQNCQK